MRFSAGTAPATALFLGAALLIPSVAPAFDEDAEKQVRQPRAGQIIANLEQPAEIHLRPVPIPTSTRQIILSLEQPIHQRSWLTSHFNLSTKKGVVYKDAFTFGEQKLHLKLWGPIVKKRPGLGFKIEGLKIGDNPIILKGYGNSRKGKLTFKMRF
jgi:hypothetical protein